MTDVVESNTEPVADVRASWDELVAVAMLGTDRRNPPQPAGVIADLVDDTVRSTPSEGMLAQVARHGCGPCAPGYCRGRLDRRWLVPASTIARCVCLLPPSAGIT